MTIRAVLFDLDGTLKDAADVSNLLCDHVAGGTRLMWNVGPQRKPQL